MTRNTETVNPVVNYFCTSVLMYCFRGIFMGIMLYWSEINSMVCGRLTTYNISNFTSLIIASKIFFRSKAKDLVPKQLRPQKQTGLDFLFVRAQLQVSVPQSIGLQFQKQANFHTVILKMHAVLMVMSRVTSPIHFTNKPFHRNNSSISYSDRGGRSWNNEGIPF